MNGTDINNDRMEMANMDITSIDSPSILTLSKVQWYWEDFPIEIWEKVLSCLDKESIISLIKSSKSQYMKCILTNVKNNVTKKDISRIPFDIYNQIIKMGHEKMDKQEVCKIYSDWEFFTKYDFILQITKIKYTNKYENKIKLDQVEVSGKWLIIKAETNLLTGYRLIHLDTKEEIYMNSYEDEEETKTDEIKKFKLVIFDCTKNNERFNPCTNDKCLCLGDMAHDYIGEIGPSGSVNKVFKLHRQNSTSELTPWNFEPLDELDKLKDRYYDMNHIDVNYDEGVMRHNIDIMSRRFVRRQYKKSPLFQYGKPAFTEGYKTYFHLNENEIMIDVSVMKKDTSLLFVVISHNKLRSDNIKIKFYEAKECERIREPFHFFRRLHDPDRSYDIKLSEAVTYWSFNGSIVFVPLPSKKKMIIFTKHKKVYQSTDEKTRITCILLRMNFLIIGTENGEIKFYKLNNLNELFNRFFFLRKPMYSCFVNKETFKPILQIVPVEWSKYLDIIVTTGDTIINSDDEQSPRTKLMMERRRHALAKAEKNIYRLKMDFEE